MNSDRIANDSELQTIKDSEGLNFPFPEMFFSSNFLTCKHKDSGITVGFNAVDALRGCKIDIDDQGEIDRTTFKVKEHKQWESRTDSNGKHIKTWREDFDWTYTTTYAGTIKEHGKAALKVPAQKDEGIDYDLLKRRDPILWYGSTQLYEDDLFDHGDSSYNVKIRVMSNCFFILGRMWLRVDDTFLRIFDTRVFHVFGTNKIIIEIKRQEASRSDLVRMNSENLLTEVRNCRKAEQVDTKLRVIKNESFVVTVRRD